MLWFFHPFGKIERKRGKNYHRTETKLISTGSNYPIKICILPSRDKNGFDMAAGGNLCDVRTEETLKIRIGRCQNFKNAWKY